MKILMPSNRPSVNLQPLCITIAITLCACSSTSRKSGDVAQNNSSVSDVLRQLIGQPTDGATQDGYANNLHFGREPAKKLPVWVADLEGRFAYRYVRVEEPTPETATAPATQLRAAVSSHILTRFREGITREEIDAYAQHLGLRAEPVPFTPGLFRMHVDASQAGTFAATYDATDANALPRLLNRVGSDTTLVANVEADYVVTTLAVPEDKKEPRVPDALWGLHNYGQTANGALGTVDADIDAPQGWDLVYKDGASVPLVRVAVIDTGIDPSHPEFKLSDGTSLIDTENDYDFVNNDADAMDDHGHGTHVAGTIAASQDGQNAVGVVRNVRIIPIKFLSYVGSGTTSGAISSVNYVSDLHANKGITLLASSNSWGGGGYSAELERAIACAGNPSATCPSKNASATPILFIAAAGNSQRNTDTSPNYPSCYAPVPFDNVIAVGASDQSDRMAAFSNYGEKTVDVFAPGVNIFSTLPNNGYAFNNGTSMATPHVTGLAVLMKQAMPEAQPDAIREGLLMSVEKKDALVNSVAKGRINAGLVKWNAPNLSIDGHVIDDTPSSGLPNNGDGRLGPGERVQLTLVLRNVGGVNAAGVTGRLRSLDTSIATVVQSEFIGYAGGQTIGRTGGTGASDTPYTVVASSADETRYARFELDLLWIGQNEAVTVPLQIKITKTIAVRGRVTLNGAAASAAQVRLFEGNVLMASDNTDADGNYGMGVDLDPSLPSRNLVLEVSENALLSKAQKSFTLNTVDAQVDMEYLSSQITVVATSEETSRPAVGAAVDFLFDFYKGTAATDNAGKVVIAKNIERSVAEMTITVSGGGQGLGAQTQRVALPAQSVELRFALPTLPYRLTRIDGALTFGSVDWTTFTDMNDHGQVVGEVALSGSGYQSFLFDDANDNGIQDPGEMTALAPRSTAMAINNEGTIVMRRSVEAYLSRPGQSEVSLGKIAFQSNAPHPTIINQLGDVAGYLYYTPIGSEMKIENFIIHPHGIGANRTWYVPGGPTGTNALLVTTPNFDIHGVNNNGQAVGFNFQQKDLAVWSEGRLIRIAAMNSQFAPRINDSGDVLFSNDDTSASIFTFNSNGPNDQPAVKITNMFESGERLNSLKGINHVLEITADYTTQVSKHGVWKLEKRDNAVVAIHREDISNYLPASSRALYVGKVNDCGQVMGFYWTGDSSRPATYLLTPIQNRGFVRVFAGRDRRTGTLHNELVGFHVDCKRNRQPEEVSWQQTEGPAATIESPSQFESRVFFPSAGNYSFRLSVRVGDKVLTDDIGYQVQTDATAVPIANPSRSQDAFEISTGLIMGQTFVSPRSSPVRAIDLCRSASDASAVPLGISVGEDATLAPQTTVLTADPTRTTVLDGSCGPEGMGYKWWRYFFSETRTLTEGKIFTAILKPATVMNFVADPTNPYNGGQILHELDPSRYATADFAMRLVY